MYDIPTCSHLQIQTCYFRQTPKIVFSPLLGVIDGKSGKIVDLNNVDNKGKVKKRFINGNNTL